MADSNVFAIADAALLADIEKKKSPDEPRAQLPCTSGRIYLPEGMIILENIMLDTRCGGAHWSIISYESLKGLKDITIHRIDIPISLRRGSLGQDIEYDYIVKFDLTMGECTVTVLALVDYEPRKEPHWDILLSVADMHAFDLRVNFGKIPPEISRKRKPNGAEDIFLKWHYSTRLTTVRKIPKWSWKMYVAALVTDKAAKSDSLPDVAFGIFDRQDLLDGNKQGQSLKDIYSLINNLPPGQIHENVRNRLVREMSDSSEVTKAKYNDYDEDTLEKLKRVIDYLKGQDFKGTMGLAEVEGAVDSMISRNTPLRVQMPESDAGTDAGTDYESEEGESPESAD